MLFNQICIQKNTRNKVVFAKSPTVFAETARDFNTDKLKNLSFFIKRTQNPSSIQTPQATQFAKMTTRKYSFTISIILFRT